MVRELDTDGHLRNINMAIIKIRLDLMDNAVIGNISRGFIT